MLVQAVKESSDAKLQEHDIGAGGKPWLDLGRRFTSQSLMMNVMDFVIGLAGECAGWATLILGLAWACSRAARREIHIYLPPAEGDAGGGRRRPMPRRPPSDAFPRQDAPRISIRRLHRRIARRQ